MQQLTGLDASFVYMETPRVPQHIFNVYVYDPSTAPGGRVTFTGILEHYRQRLHVTTTFRQKLAPVPFGLDHPYWVDDSDFGLEFHVPAHRPASTGRLAPVVYPGGQAALQTARHDPPPVGGHRHRMPRQRRRCRSGELRGRPQDPPRRD